MFQGLVDSLHSVLRPFLLRRLKSEVEKQMPGKHEHVIRCRLSKRQRTLYEDYMASSDTRSTLSSGNFLGIINVLMSLRKVSTTLTCLACNKTCQQLLSRLQICSMLSSPPDT